VFQPSGSVRLRNLIVPSAPGAEPLAEAVRACRPHLIWAAVFSALVNLLYLTPTLYMMQVYDRVVPTGSLTTLALVTAVIVFALGTLAALDWLRGRLMLRAGMRLDRLLSARILGRIVDMQAHGAGGQALREFDQARGALGGPGMLALFDAPWTPIYLLCCFLLHPAIGVLTLVGGAVLFALAWMNERDARPRIEEALKLQGSAYAAQEAVASQAEVVRALGMRSASIARQIDQRRKATVVQAGAQLAGGRYSGAIRFVRLLIQSLALGLAALLAVKHQISAGAIIASSVLLSRAVSPIEQLVGAWPSLVQARAGWLALTELFVRTASSERGRTALPPPRGRLEASNLGVQFPATSAPQLRGVGLSLSPGQTLGIVGQSGSGKTTLARVLAGALKPQAGKVRLDGAEYDARDGDELARWIGYMPQTPSLFAGTVKENISRFTPRSDGDDIDQGAVRAATAAGAHEMIQRLPRGYDTPLGPFGQGLSAGQAQRVALARALFGEPVLLVLDEPNANLDQDGEAALMKAILNAAARGAAVVVIAHRAGVLARVDHLMVMEDGKVRLHGPREEVLAMLREERETARPQAREPVPAPKSRKQGSRA